jgi:hypothetical protein
VRCMTYLRFVKVRKRWCRAVDYARLQGQKSGAVSLAKYVMVKTSAE